jgi:hypothetical protein
MHALHHRNPGDDAWRLGGWRLMTKEIIHTSNMKSFLALKTNFNFDCFTEHLLVLIR